MTNGYTPAGKVKLPDLPSWPNGQGVGLLSRRLRVRVPPKVLRTINFNKTQQKRVPYVCQETIMFAAFIYITTLKLRKQK